METKRKNDDEIKERLIGIENLIQTLDKHFADSSQGVPRVISAERLDEAATRFPERVDNFTARINTLKSKCRECTDIFYQNLLGRLIDNMNEIKELLSSSADSLFQHRLRAFGGDQLFHSKEISTEWSRCGL
mmetsp:Transcript_50871/g.58345  ORF Transcript_50871/g.58345 Transcript_50871/m.58345 type:complete len:132 (+) Transcript_50871:58-453(+)